MRRFLAILSIAAGTCVWQIAYTRNAPDESFERFVDIIDQSGIKFEHYSDPDKRYVPESMAGGVALFDFDNDGCLDIYFTNSPTVNAKDPAVARGALYKGNCNGTFTDVTAKSGLGDDGWAMGAIAGDYDGDGYQDLYITCLGSNHLYHNNHDGTFADVTQKSGTDDRRWSTGAAWGDFDRDGWLDLFVDNYVDFKLEDLPQFGKGKFCQFRGVPVQCGPRGLPGAGDSLFRNKGDGTFENVTQKSGAADPDGRYGLTAIWTDVDEDGWPDLYVANDAGPNFLYHNQKNGAFVDKGFLAGVAVGEDGNEQGSMGIALGDYLHTGRLAFFVTNFSDEYDVLYRHDKPLLYTDVTFASGIGKAMGPWVSWGTAFFDYDNDGWPDLLVVNGHVYPQVDAVAGGSSKYRQRLLLFHNNGNGTFSEVAAQSAQTLMIPRPSRGVGFGDFDNDGNIDVVVENLDGKPTILRNMSGNRNNWTTIQLVGNKPNIFAIGARVKVVSGDLTQCDEIHTGGSYISSSDLRVHVGLAKRTRVDLIEVRWPDGSVESVKDQPANHFIVIEQGKGATKATPPKTQ